jgi:hypothetical protein
VHRSLRLFYILSKNGGLNIIPSAVRLACASAALPRLRVALLNFRRLRFHTVPLPGRSDFLTWRKSKFHLVHLVDYDTNVRRAFRSNILCRSRQRQTYSLRDAFSRHRYAFTQNMKHLHKISPPSITFRMTKSFGQTAGEITQITVTTIDRPISIVHGHAKVSLSRRKITILRTARNRMRIFCNHISSLLSVSARSDDKNFCQSAGVSVGDSNRALLLREMQCANDTTRHIDFTRYEISRYYYLSMLLTVTCCSLQFSVCDFLHSV